MTPTGSSPAFLALRPEEMKLKEEAPSCPRRKPLRPVLQRWKAAGRDPAARRLVQLPHGAGFLAGWRPCKRSWAASGRAAGAAGRPQAGAAAPREAPGVTPRPESECAAVAAAPARRPAPDPDAPAVTWWGFSLSSGSLHPQLREKAIPARAAGVSVPCRRPKKQVRVREQKRPGVRAPGLQVRRASCLGEGRRTKPEAGKGIQARVPPRAEPSPGQCPGLTACGSTFWGASVCAAGA